MKKFSFILTLFFIVFLMLFNIFAVSQEQKPIPQENFYQKSLHYTNKGIEYLYSKEQGGIERITGMTASELGCLNSKCHVQSCDVCHLKEVDGISTYSSEVAKAPQICHRCHGEMEKDNPDVHFTKGMKWNLVYLDRKDTTWVPLKNPEEPLLNYSGYCSPITKEQFENLVKARNSK
ncbi:MAG: hypothetical protein OEV55_00670 [candidate division Zixibacteria bacterium]|nr:hypothetical protein [candidate division Zixibacteria bacterium]